MFRHNVNRKLHMRRHHPNIPPLMKRHDELLVNFYYVNGGQKVGQAE